MLKRFSKTIIKYYKFPLDRFYNKFRNATELCGLVFLNIRVSGVIVRYLTMRKK